MIIVLDDIIYSLQKSGGGSVYWKEVTRDLASDAYHIIYDNAIENNVFGTDNKYEALSSGGLSIKRYIDVKPDIDKTYIFHSSLYRVSRDSKALNVTTVYDFVYEKFRKDLKSYAHKIQKHHAVLNSKGVICISNNTMKDLKDYYPEYKGKIKVIYNGYDEDSFYYEKITKKDWLLFVGARTDYKRFDKAIEITQKLKKYKLVIVGGGCLTSEEIRQLDSKIPDRYIKYDYIENDKLRELYNKSRFLLYMSEYEGFGIPIIEAQACGCVVVCQRKSCMPEVAGEAAVFIDQDRIDEGIEDLLNVVKTNYYDGLIKMGLDNIRRFSWNKCRYETMQFYREILGE